MKNNISRVFAVALGVVFTVSTFALPTRLDQPHMKAALNFLRQARNHLNHATADKGGHRATAIVITDKAINDVQQGIEWDRTHPGSTDTTDILDNSIESSDQPNMVAARNDLNAALSELNRATPNHGGFRESAIGHVNDAIAEVNAGIEYDRHH